MKQFTQTHRTTTSLNDGFEWVEDSPVLLHVTKYSDKSAYLRKQQQPIQTHHVQPLLAAYR